MHIKFHENPPNERRAVPRGWTDMTKPTVSFSSFANAPKIEEASISNTE